MLLDPLHVWSSENPSCRSLYSTAIPRDLNPLPLVAGGKDEAGQQKERLLDIFGHWCDSVTDLIRATPEVDVIRRDIYDRPPIFKWTAGRVALLGDSAHAMQPNLGQVRSIS